MTANYGKIKVKLTEPIDRIPDELTALINKNIRPPQPLGPDDVYVRAMLVVSDDINSFGGRFPADELARLCALLIDSPVLVGHRKDKLPIGRNFHATLITKDGRPWVKSYFYWLKSSDGAENLRENIDGGIYKECSISFTYFFPECSVCGNDIRRCDHQPWAKIITDGVEATVHFNYRQIEKVLETSLVYRGALPDTSVTKVLEQAKIFEPGFLRAPLGTDQRSRIAYQIEQGFNPDAARIKINQGGKSSLMVVRHFNLNRLRHGARFVTEVLSKPVIFPTGTKVLGRGEVTSLIVDNGLLIFEMNGLLEGTYALRTVELASQTGFLFYKIESQETQFDRGRFVKTLVGQTGVSRGDVGL